MINPAERMEWMKTLCVGEGKLKIEREEELAEFMEDVNRIVQCTASPRVQNKTLEATSEGVELHIQGSCCFRVVYRSNNRMGEGAYCGAEFSSDFEYRASYSVEGDFDPDLLSDRTELVVDGAVCRPLGARKLQLRGELSVQTCIKGNHLAPNHPLEQTEDLQILPLCRNASVLKAKAMREISLEHELALPGDYPQIHRVLDGGVKLFFEDCQVNSGGITFRATASVSCCYLPVGEDASPVSFSLPLEASQALECDVKGEGYAWVQGYPTDLKMEVAADANGENRNLLISLSYLAEGAVCETQSIQDSADCYSTKEELQVTYGDLQAEEVKYCSHLNSVLDVELPLKDNEITGVEMLRTTLSVGGATAESQGIRVQGKLKLNMLGIKADGTALSFKEESEVSLLFRPEGAGELLKNNAMLHMELSADVKDVDCTVKEGQLSLHLGVCSQLVLLERHHTRRVIQVQSLGARERQTEGKIILYYPEKGEEPWEIGKRFAVPMDEVHRQMEKDGTKTPSVMLLVP